MSNYKILILLFSGIFLNACIWGSGNESRPVFYNGKTTPIEITEDNGKEVAAEGMSGGQTLGGAALAGAEINGDSVKVSAVPVIFKIARGLEAVLINDHTNAPSISVSGAVITESGNCGGSISYEESGDIDSINYRYTATIDDYCEDGITQAESIDVSGTEATFKQLRTYSAGFDVSMNGSITFSGFNNNSTAFSFTANIDFRDNITNETGRLEDYKISASADTDEGFSIKITGRIYTSQFGYVDITTISPLTINYFTDNFSGEMLFTGQNSSVTLTFIGNGDIRVTVKNGSRIVSVENLSFEDIFSEI